MSLISSLIGEKTLINPFTRDMFDNNPYMNWKETPSEHVFEFDLSGLSKEDVKLELHDGNVLRVSGERKIDVAEDIKEKWHCLERWRGEFSRDFILSEDVKVEEIKASMNFGVLVITVPKNHELIKLKKNVKQHGHFRKEVKIMGSDNDENQRSGKGFSKFVSCKA